MEYRSKNSCKSTENHPAHNWDHNGTRWDGSTYSLEYTCPGWETTQWVIVTDAEGNEMGRMPVDLRSEFEGPYLSDLRATVEYEAQGSKHLEGRAGQPLSQTEREILLAIGTVAPNVCPWDSDRCHEHLWPIKEKHEEEWEE